MAIADLIQAVERGEWPGGIDGLARQVFPYTSSSFDDHGLKAAEAFDGDLNAAVALLEAVLPGWFWSVAQNIHHGTFYARVTPPGNLPDFGATSDDNPARALLLAILKALAAKGRNDDR